MQAKITKRSVDSAGPREDGKDLWLWDTELKGFGLKVRPGGSRSYVVEYRPGAGGRGAAKRRITIGRHGSPWTPVTARREAEKILGFVAAGSDPAADKSVLRGAPTVAEFAERHMAESVMPKRKAKTETQYRALLDNAILPALGGKKVRDVTRQDVIRLHSSMGATPYQANRCLSLLSALFTQAELHGERPAASNPARKVERFKEESRERLLSPLELACLGDALREAEQDAARRDALQERLQDARSRHAAARAVDDRKEGGATRREVDALRAELRPMGGSTAPVQVIACLRLLLFTGARLNEILALRWVWVDLARAELRLPDSKTGRKTIHLPSPALEVLAELPRLAGNPFVLCGEREGGHFVGIQRPWRRIRAAATVKFWQRQGGDAAALVERLAAELGRQPLHGECIERAAAEGIELPAGLSDLRIHDLRHGFASVAAGAGLGLPIIGKLLGHSQPATTNRYAHLASDPLKSAAAAVAESIAAAMTQPTAPVEPLRLVPKKAAL